MIDEPRLHAIAGATQIAENAERARAKLGMLTEEEMAAALSLSSVSTLATWRSQGKGPSYAKLGKSVFYMVDDVADWIIENTINPEAKPAPANDNVLVKKAV